MKGTDITMTLALISQTNYDNILSTYLNVVDTDPSYDIIEGLLADIIAARNSSQWMIGDLLVFFRHRTDYHTVKTFNWTGELSKRLVDFIQERYKVDLQALTNDTKQGEFLCWQVIRHKKFWLLLDGDEVRVWEYNPSTVSDQEFNQYLDNLNLRLKAELGQRSLRAYYRTSAIYPPSERTPHSWTFHYERSNYAASKISPEIKGEERLKQIASVIPETTEELESTNINTVNGVREKIKQYNQNERGYNFKTTLPETLIIIDTKTGETFNGLEFVTGANPEAIMAILAASGIYSYVKGCELTLIENKLYDSQNRLIATCPYIDEVVVAEAISYLAEKMGWEIKYETN